MAKEEATKDSYLGGISKPVAQEMLRFEQTARNLGGQPLRVLRSSAEVEYEALRPDHATLGRELRNQQEQIQHLTYTIDRQVSRLSRELELLREQQERSPKHTPSSLEGDTHWRLREDVDALSRRVDGLEAFCRDSGGSKGNTAASPGSIQAELEVLKEQMRNLQEDCHLERTRDVAGLRARAEVEKLAAACRAEQSLRSKEIEVLNRQLHDILQILEVNEAVSGVTRTSLGSSPLTDGQASNLQLQLAKAASELRSETTARCSELRSELLSRLEALEAVVQAHASARLDASYQSIPSQPSARSPNSASNSSQEHDETKPLIGGEVKVTLDRLVSKLTKTLQIEAASVGEENQKWATSDLKPRSTSNADLKASSDVFRRCLQELRRDRPHGPVHFEEYPPQSLQRLRSPSPLARRFP